jgi:hypothetical protein
MAGRPRRARSDAVSCSLVMGEESDTSFHEKGHDHCPNMGRRDNQRRHDGLIGGAAHV